MATEFGFSTVVAVEHTHTHTRSHRLSQPPTGLQVPLGVSLPAACETDIFAHLGLPYVPPHLRDLSAS